MVRGCVGVELSAGGGSGTRWVWYSADPSSKEVTVERVPVLWAETALTSLFSGFGDVTQVSITPDRRATVSFSGVKAVRKLLAFAKDQVLPYIPNDRQRGIQAWESEFWAERPSGAQLEKAVAEFMAVFYEEQRAEQEARKMGGQVDEDGFTVVQPKKKRKRVIPKLNADDEDKVREKRRKIEEEDKATLERMYGFAKREAQKLEKEKLKQQFLEDVKRARELHKLKFSGSQ